MARTYKVAAGDTLSGIAQRFYGDGSLFTLIAAANEIANPDQIPAGKVLSIPDLPQHWEVFQTTAKFHVGTHPVTFEDKVPRGERLVIETVSGFYLGAGAVLGAARLSPSPGPVLRCAFPWIQCGSVNDVINDQRFFGFNHCARLYCDGPTMLVMEAELRILTTGGICSGQYHISGFLEALPAA